MATNETLHQVIVLEKREQVGREVVDALGQVAHHSLSLAQQLTEFISRGGRRPQVEKLVRHIGKVVRIVGVLEVADDSTVILSILAYPRGSRDAADQ